MRRLLPLLAFVLSACSEDPPPGPPIGDADVADRPFFPPVPRDGGSDADADPMEGGTDLDAGGLLACTGDVFDVRPSAAGSNVEIAVAGGPSSFVVAWTETVAGETDLAARHVPASGSLGVRADLPTNTSVESGPSVVANGNAFLVAFRIDNDGTRDVVAVPFATTDTDLGAFVNVSSDVNDDGAPRLFNTSEGTMMLWHRPPTSALVTELGSDGTPGATGSVGTTPLPVTPLVIDRGANGHALLLRAAASSVSLLPIDATGMENGSLMSAIVAGAGPRVAFSQVGGSGRVFVESTTSLFTRALSASGELSGSATVAPTSGTNERAPAAVGVGEAHLLAYRTTFGGEHQVRLATLAGETGAVIADLPLATLANLDGELAIARAADGGLLVVFTDVAASNVAVRAARLTCAGEVP